MGAHSGLFRVLIVLALVLCATTTLAQDIVAVDRPGVIRRGTTAKDRDQKSFRLKKGEQVQVESERGDWYWVQNKKGRAGWVKKRVVQLEAATADAAGNAPTVPAVSAQIGTPPPQTTTTPAGSPPQSSPPTIDAAPGQLKIAVMDLRGTENLSERLLGFLSTVVAETLDGLGPFKSISSQDIAQMLAYESDKQLLGCDEITCLAEIGGALGADYLISGSVSQVDSLYVLQLQLTDIKRARVEARVSREHTGEAAALFPAVRAGTKQLVRDLLAARSGTLALHVNEESASVLIDDAIVGVSPLAPLTVSGGVHTLAIEKQGFVVYRQDIEIQQDRTLELHVTLSPSAEYRRQFRDQAQLFRTIALVTAGVGALSLGAGGLLFYDYTMNQMPGMDARIAAYNAQAVRTREQYDALRGGVEQMNLIEKSALGFTAAGLLVTTAGACMLLLGDDPGRYE